MKYVIVQGDGMADRPQEELSGLTPLAAADTPNMDAVAGKGGIGLVETIPPLLPPGSSVGNISLMGLNPEEHFTGRAPLEARGQGVEIGPDDVAFRCNLVKFGENGHGSIMEDYSGGHPSDSEAETVIREMDESIGGGKFRFYSGVSYRHLMVWKGGRNELDWKKTDLTPPHDISGRAVVEHLPEGAGSDALVKLQEQGRKVLSGYSGEPNGIWFWGAGVRPDIPTFKQRYGLEGSVISAVDLIKGIGSYAGLEPVDVEGATGFIDTNYEGKVKAVLDGLGEDSLVFVHIEAPDEASHMGELDTKLKAIEKVDELVVGPLLSSLAGDSDTRIMTVTDHITGLQSGTHERGSVPFAVSDADELDKPGAGDFSESAARESGKAVAGGPELFDLFLSEGS
jgi:2,3-bisphosphoglycerate-independent phosphoglycerate mutase